MNRTDRLLAIILELQGKGRQRAEDLAETFETSKRTIYRHIQALGEAGVPIVSIPGLGYSLMKGYFLPPLSFTTDEATMLLLGSDLMAQSFDAQYRSAALAASRKIEGVLPEKLRDEVSYLQESIAHYAVRVHLAQSAVQAELDPDRLSFTEGLFELTEMIDLALTLEPQEATEPLLSRLRHKMAQHALPERRLRINRREVKQVSNKYKPKKRQLPPPEPFDPEDRFLDFVDLLDPLALQLAGGGP